MLAVAYDPVFPDGAYSPVLAGIGPGARVHVSAVVYRHFAHHTFGVYDEPENNVSNLAAAVIWVVDWNQNIDIFIYFWK